MGALSLSDLAQLLDLMRYTLPIFEHFGYHVIVLLLCLMDLDLLSIRKFVIYEVFPHSDLIWWYGPLDVAPNDNKVAFFVIVV